MRYWPFLFIATVLFIVACARQAPRAGGEIAPSAAGVETAVPQVDTPPAETESSQATIAAPAPHTPTAPPTLAPATVTTVAAATATIAPSPTADPYEGLTIEDLAARSYGGGDLRIVETIHVTESFTRTLVAYDSDGLTVYGFMNVPFGQGPFPVALVLHGYIPPRQYGTIGYTARYADFLARAGYLVVHPNYRNHPPSDESAAFAAGLPEEDFRVGYAVDVLNLLAIIQQRGGKPGSLAQANPAQLHLLGHSMGGGIALRAITVNPDIDAAVLYGSMSGDEAKNYERIQVWSNGETGAKELETPPEDLQRISPIFHLSRVEAAVSIHHGGMDEIVPPEWSVALCQQLRENAKVVECFSYPGAPHSFHDEVDRLFQERVLDFFSRY